MAVGPAGAPELRAALQDVIAAQRAQQASARGAAPASRPRLRNSRCVAWPDSVTLQEFCCGPFVLLAGPASILTLWPCLKTWACK